MEGRLYRKDSDNKLHEADGEVFDQQEEEQAGGMRRPVSSRTTTTKKKKKHRNKATTRHDTPSNDVTNINAVRTTSSSSAITSNTTRKQKKKKKLRTPTDSTSTQRTTNGDHSIQHPRQHEKEYKRGDEKDALWNDLVIGETTQSATASGSTSAAHTPAVIKKKKKKTRISRQRQRHQVEQNRRTASLLAAPEAVPSINGSEHEPDTFEQEFDLEASNQQPYHNDNGNTMPSSEGTHPAVGDFAVHGDQILPREAHLSTQVSDVGFSTIDDDHADNLSEVLVPEAELVVPPAEGPPQPNAPLVHADAVSDINSPPKRRNRFIVLGVVAVLVVALVVSVTMSLANPNPSEPTSQPSTASPSSTPKTTRPPTNAPTFLPTLAPSPAPVALLPDGSWQPLGQELGGKASGDHFGESVSLSRNARVLAVGATQTSDNPGFVSIFQLDDLTGPWVVKGQELVGEANGDEFGWSVALNGDGSILAVGACLNDGGGDNAGHVRVFQHGTWNRWVQLGSDIDGEAVGDRFGWSVSLSKAGDILAAGAHRSDNRRGSVRTFQYDLATDSWVQLGRTLVGQAEGDDFGNSVSLSSSGAIVAIGAPWNDLGGSNAGQVVVYQYNYVSSEWDPIGSPINGQIASGHFGWSVSLDDSGLVVAVGAPSNIFADERVLVYTYNTLTSAWNQRGQMLKSQQLGNNFGHSVSLSGNSNVLAVGSRYHDANGLEYSGQVTIFQYSTNTMTWHTVGEPLNGKAADDEFRESVSLSEDGTVVAVGATGRDRDSGTASVYALN